MAIFGNLFGQIFGDSAAELESQGDYFAGVNNWRRATDEYRRALQRTSKNSIGYRRLAAKFDDARLKCFDALVDEIHSHLDVREFTYAADQITLARGMAENDAQRERLDECERRLRGAGRGAATSVRGGHGGVDADFDEPTPTRSSRAAGSTAARYDGDVSDVEAERDYPQERLAPLLEPSREAVSRPAPARSDTARPEMARPEIQRSVTARREAAPRTGLASGPAASIAPAGRPGRDPNADQTFQKLLTRMSNEEAAHRMRLGAHYRDAVIAHAQGEAGRAAELFKKVAAEHPEDVVVQYDLAAALAAAGRSREAMTLYLRIAERCPNDWQPWYEIALLQWAEGLRERAITTIEEGLEMHPRSGYLMAQWGVLLHKMGDRRGALDKFYQALQLDSFDDAGLYHVVANLHLDLGDLEKARRGYLKALELNGHSIGTMLDYAEFLVDRKQDPRAALAVLETAFRTMRAKPGPKLQHAYRSYLTSRAHMLLGEREMALLAVTRALEENDQAWLEDTLEEQRQAVLAV